jgi:arginase family enzyme
MIEIQYRLIPSIDTATLVNQYYIFDRTAETSNIVYVPTQPVSAALYSIVKRIKECFPTSQPVTLQTIKELFLSPNDHAKIDQLVASGYLEEVPSYSEAGNHSQSKINSPEYSEPPASHDFVSYFRTKSVNHYMKRPSFFNLPEKIHSQNVDVGVVGVPVSTVPISNGTIYSPNQLRQYSQRNGFWFDFYKDGIYSEVGCDGTAPQIMCKNVVLKDFGDIANQPKTVGQVFHDIDTFIQNEILPHDIRPLFVGGDHAITFPIVDSLLKNHPNLTVIHLDAHNDLYYTERVEFTHAGPIQGLLMHSGLQKVLSFGLRTNADTRVATHNRLSREHGFHDKVSMYSIGALRRRLNDPEKFTQYLIDTVGKNSPCYLSIDLDVLSESAMSGQLSTPAGHGMEFHELYEFVEIVMQSLNVVGSDIVELNADTSNSKGGPQRDTMVLLMCLINGLAASKERVKKDLFSSNFTEKKN